MALKASEAPETKEPESVDRLFGQAEPETAGRREGRPREERGREERGRERGGRDRGGRGRDRFDRERRPGVRSGQRTCGRRFGRAADSARRVSFQVPPQRRTRRAGPGFAVCESEGCRERGQRKAIHRNRSVRRRMGRRVCASRRNSVQAPRASAGGRIASDGSRHRSTG